MPKTSLRREAALAAAAALVGGVAWALCHGREPRLLLPWVALAPLAALCAFPRGGRWGLVHGLVAWLVAIPWVVETLVVFGDLPRALSWALLGLLCLYLGAFHAVFVALGRPLWRAGTAWTLAGLPSLWVALEHARGWLLGGFPWNLAGYAWADVPGALPATAWVGTWGVSWLLVFANAGVARGVVTRRWLPAAVGVLVPLAVLPAAGRWSEPRLPAGPRHPVRVVQPNLPIRDLDAAILQASYARVMAMAEEVCAAGAGAGDGDEVLVVLPESATWPYSYQDSPRLRADLGRLAARGCTLVLNSTVEEPAGLFNVALLVGADGVAGRYDKRHLVPFGEYVPFAGVLPFVSTLARNAGTFTAGRDAALLDWRGERIAVAICYEITHAAAVAEQVRAGATLLVTVTNDAWYGDTTAPWQHFRAVRFRAAETRRPTLRAALTGVSALVDARGGVDALLGVGEEGVLAARVGGGHGLSPYVRAPWLVPAASTAVAVAGLAFAIIPRRRGGRPPRPASSPPPHRSHRG